MTSNKLVDASVEEQRAFFDSFDLVFCDVDGVIWKPPFGHIEGAASGVNALRKLGKRICFVTNNSLYATPLLVERFKDCHVTPDEIVRPIKAFVWYLKQLKFNRAVYVVGSDALKDALREEGYEVVSREVARIPETSEGILAQLAKRRDDVGAVIIDAALNMDVWGLQMCTEYLLKNPGCLFLVGATDPVVPYNNGSYLIPPIHYIRIVESITKKQPIALAKPEPEFNELLKANLGPYENDRVLFIGDSVVTDMEFANRCGYRKLLTLTGLTAQADLDDWKHDRKLLPDFVVDSLKDLGDVIDKLQAINFDK